MAWGLGSSAWAWISGARTEFVAMAHGEWGRSGSYCGAHAIWGDETPTLFKRRWGVFWWPPKKRENYCGDHESKKIALSPPI